jgi:hypothetical protein
MDSTNSKLAPFIQLYNDTFEDFNPKMSYWFGGHNQATFDGFNENIRFDEFDLDLEKLREGTLNEEEIDQIIEHISTEGECGNIFTFIDISTNVDKLNNLLSETKIRLVKQMKDEEDYNESNNNFDLDKAATIYCYFKLGAYYFYIYAVDCYYAYESVHKQLTKND